METVQMVLKRMRSHSSSYKNELIRPAVVYSAAQYLVKQPLYIDEGVKLEVDWAKLHYEQFQKFIADPNDELITDDQNGLSSDIPDYDNDLDEQTPDDNINPNKEETYLKEGIIFAPGEGLKPNVDS